MIVHKFKPGSPEWLGARMLDITGTELPAIFGLHKYNSPAKVMREKINPSVRTDNPYTRAGRLMENAVMVAMNEIGIPAIAADPSKVVYVRHANARLGASMDGKAVEEGWCHIVECKTTAPHKFNDWKVNPPIEYMIQVQAQMLVCNISQCLLACLGRIEPIYPLIVYEVTADLEIQKIILEEVERCWEHIQSGDKFKVNKSYKEMIISSIFGNAKLVFADNHELC